MQFKLSTVVLATLLAAVPALAAPATIVPEPEEGLSLTHQVETAEGTLSYYAQTPGSEVAKRAAEGQLNKRCGSNKINCSGDNEATITLCQTLASQLAGSNTAIGGSTRSICLSINSQGTCCVSWGSDAGFTESALAGVAKSSINSCANHKHNGYVSAVVGDVLIGNVCLNQCLSNRAKGCPS